MKYSPELIEQVRASVDIVDYIAQFVMLKKRGKSHIGLCPFHQEKTPSFHVSADKQLYYCFGCAKGGTIYNFVEEYEKLSFIEAVQKLAERAGIVLPQYTVHENVISEIEEAYEVLKRTAKIFHDQLVHSNEGKFALEYFRHRGFTDDTIRKFGLGYAPRSWDFLTQKFLDENISLEIGEKVGVLRKREDTSIYSAFRGRAMFPIFSPMGKVVGFGARKLYDDDTLGKYINSSESFVYNKSKILYGLNFSKDAIREKEYAILVEGYADFLSLFQAGIENVVASSGTALTEEQVQLLSRYTKSIVILYDADSAGSVAALRGIDVVLQKNLDVRVAQLSKGHDPDSYVRTFGKDETVQRIINAVSFIEFLTTSFQEKGTLSTPEGLTSAIRTIVQYIAKIPDELKRTSFVKSIAKQFALRESVLLLELEKKLHVFSPSPQIRARPTESIRENEETIFPAQRKLVTPAEKEIIALLIEGDNDLVHYIFEHTPIEALGENATKLFQLFEQQFTDVGTLNVAALLDTLTTISKEQAEEVKTLINEIFFDRYTLSKSWFDAGNNIPVADLGYRAFAAIISLQKSFLQNAYEKNQEVLKYGNADEQSQAIHQLQVLREQMKNLDAQLNNYRQGIF
ncbi:MAG: DNA primase [Ignavibacteria bacterium]|nr:DNA primase [Ignavibacteria bacterium]